MIKQSVVQALEKWAVQKYSAEDAVIVVLDKASGAIIGMVRTDNATTALQTLAESFEPEDPIEVLDWLKDNTKLETYTVMTPK